MKKLLFILFPLHSFATTYYISAAGSTSNNGLTALTSWPLSKVNSFAFSPGDNVLFNQGDVFYGTISITHAGSSGSPITYSTYGTGLAPVITGLTSVTSWTHSGNIYTSTSAVSSLSTCNMVVINGVNTGMGRFPNTGYDTYTSPGTNSIVCSSLNSSTTDWTGAEVVDRQSDFHTNRNLITSHSGTTINYSPIAGANTSTGTSGYGCFIQNDIRTLDVQNEWYYDGANINIYSASTPTGVQVASLTNLLSDNGFDYITVDGLDFEGSNGDALEFGSSNCDHVIVQNCTINFSGAYGINFLNGTLNLVNNNTITNCVGNAINVNTTSSTITNNTIKYIGIIPGQAPDGNLSRGVLVTANTGCLIQYNTVIGTGSCGLSKSSNVQTLSILNNRVDSTVLVINDQGAIYANGNSTSILIDGNIVSNTIGNSSGGTQAAIGVGIYLDELATNITATNNTAFGCSYGIKVHKSSSLTINGNVCFNNATAQIDYEDQTTVGIINHITCKNNIFVSKSRSQLCFSDRNTNSSPNNLANYWDVLDSNVYARPVSEADSIFLIRDNAISSGAQNYNILSYWKSTYSPFDSHSNASPMSITDVNDLYIYYNFSGSTVSQSLPYMMKDYASADHNSGSISIPAYRSVVLIKNGVLSNLPPIRSNFLKLHGNVRIK